MKNQTPTMATPTMANTKASNGELTLKMPMDSESSLKNIGTRIWNPLTQKYVGRGHYNKLKRDGIELCQLNQNSWITEFHGTLTEEDFLSQPHIQMLTNNKHTPLVEPATEEEHNLESTIVTQATQMDELTKELNLERLTSQQLRHEFEKLRESALKTSRMADDLVKSCDKVLGLDDKPF